MALCVCVCVWALKKKKKKNTRHRRNQAVYQTSPSYVPLSVAQQLQARKSNCRKRKTPPYLWSLALNGGKPHTSSDRDIIRVTPSGQPGRHFVPFSHLSQGNLGCNWEKLSMVMMMMTLRSIKAVIMIIGSYVKSLSLYDINHFKEYFWFGLPTAAAAAHGLDRRPQRFQAKGKGSEK